MDLSSFTLKDLRAIRAACAKREAELSSSAKAAKEGAIRLQLAAIAGEMATAEKSLNDAKRAVVQHSKALRSRYNRLEKVLASSLS
jgi:uncharacterized membrane protein (DUF4010 family)